MDISHWMPTKEGEVKRFKKKRKKKKKTLSGKSLLSSIVGHLSPAFS